MSIAGADERVRDAIGRLEAAARLCRQGDAAGALDVFTQEEERAELHDQGLDGELHIFLTEEGNGVPCWCPRGFDHGEEL